MTTHRPATASDFVLAFYPALLLLARELAPPRAATLPATYDACSDDDRTFLSGLVAQALQDVARDRVDCTLTFGGGFVAGSAREVTAAVWAALHDPANALASRRA